MKEHGKKRDAASDAVIELRTAMGMTQAQFAVREMKTAVTTVARWETTHPPRGETLLRLAGVAGRRARRQVLAGAFMHKMLELRDTFRVLYAEQVHRNLGVELMTVPAGYGYLLKKLEGPEEWAAAASFMCLLSGFRSTDPETKQAAVAGFKAMREACTANPILSQIQDAILSAQTGDGDEK
jgi:transcriptional regulator with XRE-family HTH domain